MSITLEQAVHDELMRTGPVKDIIVEDRIYYGQVAQGAQLIAPYVHFTAISRVTPETYQGDSGPLDARFQFDCYAATAPVARNLAREVRRMLQGFQGMMPTGAGTQILVQSALCEGGDAGRDGYDDSVRLHVCSVDIIVSTADV